MYNYKTVFYTLGTLQIILGVFMLIPVIIQLIYNELDSAFVSASIFTIIFVQGTFASLLLHTLSITFEIASKETIVLPDPTSPCKILNILFLLFKSKSISFKTIFWLFVRRKGRFSLILFENNFLKIYNFLLGCPTFHLLIVGS